MSKTYPDIYFPSSIKQALDRDPPTPAAPLAPSKPGPQPQQFSPKSLLAWGGATLVFSLLTQSFVIFLVGAVITLFIGVSEYNSYPKRLAQYEESLRQFDRDYQKYLRGREDHADKLKKIQSPAYIQQYRLSLVLKALQHTYPPDGSDSKAMIGSSERYFARILERYFSCKIKTGQILTIPDFDYPYTPDFCYIDGNLHIDIEIDEPYIYKSKKTYHYLQDSRESNRHKFFLDRNWLILRFAEEQVCRYPESCCKVVAQVISNITGEPIPPALRSVQDLPEVKRWTQSEAQRMAQTNYRDTYLNLCQ